jgi:hypothetical protein
MEIGRLNKLMIPVALAVIALAVIWVLPVAARTNITRWNTPSNMPLRTQDIVLSGTDVLLGGGQLPEVAANNSFVAAVWDVNNSQVWLRAVKEVSATWGIGRKVADGSFPKLALGVTNTLYIVWKGPVSGATKAIKFAVCKLDQPLYGCQVKTDVVTATSDTLYQPDVVVDTDNRIHVAWFDKNAKLIKIAYSSNEGASWTSGSSIDVDSFDANTVNDPVLAASDTYVHLAFRGYGTTLGWEIFYVRFNKSNDTLIGQNEWRSEGEPVAVTGYITMSHPAIAAAGSNVYLTWDNEYITRTGFTPQYYGLVGTQSSNEGVTWPPLAAHITSTHATSTDDPTDHKLSQAGTFVVPEMENGLRPSLAVTASNNFAIVWQQEPSSSSSVNCTSEIYFAPNSSNWAAAGNGTLADETQYYAIDPDVARDNSGTHVVFMKALDQGCIGGGSGGYSIYYRGPFTQMSGTDTYLPIILKNR